MPSFSPYFDKLFEAGIDPEPGHGPSDQPSDWPSLQEVRCYVEKARKQVDEGIERVSQERLHVAIEHRLMHAETLAYLLQNRDWETRPVQDLAQRGTAPENPLIAISAGAATLGQAAGRFGWDNEFSEHSVAVPAFAISKYNITNGEYLRFVETTGAAAPHFWTRQNDAWFYQGMFGLIPLPLDWPVYVMHDEASAYAKWVGKSLPTEPQFHRAAYGTPEGSERAYPWGDASPRSAHGNFDFHHWDPIPVTATPAGDSAFGVSQLLGNGWEWTSTVFAPFDGFQPRGYYPGYSANFFDHAHFVIKGGSPRTAACFLRRSFRNWFRPNYPYVYAGFRLVEN